LSAFPLTRTAAVLAKQNGRDQICLRDVLSLKVSEGKAPRDDQDVAAWICFQIVSSATKSHRSSCAAEFGERQCGGTFELEAHEIDEVGTSEGIMNPVQEYGDDEVHFVRAHTGALQTLFRRLPAELYGVLDVFLVVFESGRGSTVVFDRKIE